jgi:hypothetical protein
VLCRSAPVPAAQLRPGLTSSAESAARRAARPRARAAWAPAESDDRAALRLASAGAPARPAAARAPVRIRSVPESAPARSLDPAAQESPEPPGAQASSPGLSYNPPGPPRGAEAPEGVARVDYRSDKPGSLHARKAAGAPAARRSCCRLVGAAFFPTPVLTTRETSCLCQARIGLRFRRRGAARCGRPSTGRCPSLAPWS